MQHDNFVYTTFIDLAGSFIQRMAISPMPFIIKVIMIKIPWSR